jgi:RimJ/RimL family protein N-acetyltransferase
VEVHRAQEADWQALRELRLGALAEAPDAFASTLEREAAFPDDVWRQRAKGGPASANFIVGQDGAAVGMAAVVAEPAPGRMQLVGMWVDPRHRRRGVAQALISQAVRWSRERQARELIAWVAEPNTAARRLDARVGFRPAGGRQPLPSTPPSPSSCCACPWTRRPRCRSERAGRSRPAGPPLGTLPRPRPATLAPAWRRWGAMAPHARPATRMLLRARGWMTLAALGLVPVLLWVPARPLAERFATPSSTLHSLANIAALVGTVGFALALVLGLASGTCSSFRAPRRARGS